LDRPQSNETLTVPNDPADISALVALARTIAVQQGLSPSLVCAVIEQESAWNPYAIRYEPAFRTRYVAPLRLPVTEEIARSISWGLMQVVGQVARENGFVERFLPTLCDPATGIRTGCIVLRKKMDAASGDLNRALGLWNGGANKDYAAQVFARIPQYSPMQSPTITN
jgi:soluble lytic murein transglycosylase-like protein